MNNMIIVACNKEQAFNGRLQDFAIKNGIYLAFLPFIELAKLELMALQNFAKSKRNNEDISRPFSSLGDYRVRNNNELRELLPLTEFDKTIYFCGTSPRKARRYYELWKEWKAAEEKELEGKKGHRYFLDEPSDNFSDNIFLLRKMRFESLERKNAWIEKHRNKLMLQNSFLDRW